MPQLATCMLGVVINKEKACYRGMLPPMPLLKNQHMWD